ncbi:MAG TPA: fumarylacetoacetate hydrolase family protein, partial [Caulobacteraceae bacterium]|nr:fumarylacetoacetate hydrolase family protein [Caulobacteraceae bacterium]
ATPLPEDLSAVEIAPTLGLLFATDCGPGVSPSAAIGAACLALDVGEPGGDFYRPAIRQRCRDGFLPLGDFGPWAEALARVEIVTYIDAQEAHRWSLARLIRPVDRLVRDLADFMTLRAGDLLLVGLPDDAPLARAGQSIAVSASGLPTLRTRIEAQA